MQEFTQHRDVVFISYSSRNAVIANRVKSHLKSLGINCWMAPESLMPGERWAEAIARVIPDSRMMVLLWTRESMKSEQVINELTLADRSSVMIMPLRIDNVEPEGAFKYYLYKTHWLDATDNDWEQKLGVLGQRVLSNLSDSSLEEGLPIKSSHKTSRNQFTPNKLNWIAIGAAAIVISTLAVVGRISNLKREPAISTELSKTSESSLAKCKVQQDGRQILNTICRFKQFGGNGSFSLYPHDGSSDIIGFTSLTLTVIAPKQAEVRGLVQGGISNAWGSAEQDSLEPACWKSNQYRICVYAL